ncbi:MAG: HU family DNA-binding protein [Clostridia bacterium]|nr:HU family DNA-binding protein [Clostridia bacterium]
MNKTQIIDDVVAKTGLKKKDVEATVCAVVDSIEATLVAGDKVQLSGLGTFSIKTKAARTGRNPKTQATITIPATKTVAFTVSKSLKESLNK